MMRRRIIAVVIIVIVVMTTTTTTTTTTVISRIREEGRGVISGKVVGILVVIVRVMTTAADGAAEAEGRDLPTEFVDGHLILRRRRHLQ
jgi:hypothetical protein